MRQRDRKRGIAWGVSTVCMLLVLSACSQGAGMVCSTIGGSNQLTVSLQPKKPARLARLRIELCQAHRCGELAFESTPPDRRYLYVEKGVRIVDANTYLIELGALGRGWKPDVRAQLAVEELAADKTTLARHTESFKFRKTYPNGKDCDVTPYLSHRTRVVLKDRVS